MTAARLGCKFKAALYMCSGLLVAMQQHALLLPGLPAHHFSALNGLLLLSLKLHRRVLGMNALAAIDDAGTRLCKPGAICVPSHVKVLPKTCAPASPVG